MKYKVYFEQVNQTWYQVDAKDEEEAIVKAERIWKADNLYPSTYVEVNE